MLHLFLHIVSTFVIIFPHSESIIRKASQACSDIQLRSNGYLGCNQVGISCLQNL